MSVRASHQPRAAVDGGAPVTRSELRFGASVFKDRSTSWWLSQLSLFVLLWLSLIKLPDLPTTELDASWRMVIAHATEHGLQFGRDIAFTYGPMGYLLSYTYAGKLLAGNWIWQIGGNLFIAAGLWRFGTMLSTRRTALYYGFLFCLGSIFSDAMLMNFIIVFALMMIRPEFQRWYWLTVIGSFFAIFSLMKFTSLFLCGFIVMAATAFFLSANRRREAAVLGGSFVLGFLVGWVGYGQSLRALPDFIEHGLEVSLGYPGAMAEDAPPAVFWCGLIAALGIGTYFVLYLASERDRLKAWYATSVLGAICLLNWKHGFTRADGHVLAHFIPLLIIVCAYPVLTDDTGRHAKWKALALWVSAVASVAGIAFFMPVIVTMAAQSWNYRVRQVVYTLTHFSAEKNGLRVAWDEAADKVRLKYIPDYVGNERVTHLGDDQGYSLLNGFNFAPMPSIQSYSAYTPALNELNYRFLSAPSGPRYVIQRYQALQPRLPPLEDSLTQKALYQSYYYELEEGGLILWRRPSTGIPNPLETEQLLLDKTVRFDETIPIPETGGRPVWAEVHIASSFLGRLRQLFYKPPHLEFSAEYADGTKERFRFVQAMGKAGFILSPLFRSGKDLIAYQTQNWDHPVTRFSLHHTSGTGRFWRPEITVRLSSIGPFQRASDGLSVKTPERFRMTNQPPIQAEAHVPPMNIFEGGKHLLHMHAPSRLEFNVPEGFSGLSAAFGLMPSAYTPPRATDGVEFSINWIAPSGRTEELYRRVLKPAEVNGDRGLQKLAVDAPQVKGGKLVFLTLPGGAGNTAFDWSYWTDVEFR